MTHDSTTLTPTQAIVAAVDAALAMFFATRSDVIAAMGPTVVNAAEALANFVLRGGKRTRPAFAWTGWLGAGGDPDSPQAAAVLDACAALELVHACALIHDDIIDCSDTRRGVPTVHVDFADRHRHLHWTGDPAQFGSSVAILVGDLALAWADDMVAAADLDPAARGRFAPVWSALRTEVVGGQLLDIHGGAGADESVAAALRINRYKTASYTIERPLQLGAALAGADDDLIAAYRAFGADVGIAFQLRDDVLGVFGDPAVTGKPAGDDLREGKRTVLIAEALRRADTSDPESAALLRAALGTELTSSQVTQLRTILARVGAVDAVEQRIRVLTDRGLAVLEQCSATPEAKRHLAAMALAATERVA